jgi:hypothetical protein
VGDYCLGFGALHRHGERRECQRQAKAQFLNYRPF